MEPIISSEQFSPPPPPVEVPKVLEIPKTPEVSVEAGAETEATPEKFGDLTTTAKQELQADKEKAFKSADDRVSYAGETVKLEPEKTASVFHEGGFAGRISAIKEKISGLVQGTKQRIQTLRSKSASEPEIPKMEPFKIAPKEMVSEDKGFEPNRMIKRYNLFGGVSPEERHARVDEFKENLMGQKEGLVAMQGDIVRMIRENPDANIEDIKKIIEPQLEAAHANLEQKKALDQILTKYSEAHQTVRQYRERIPDDRRLFMEVFNFWPTGEVKIVEGAITLGFDCKSQEDFARIYTYNYGGGEKISPEDAAEMAGRVAGFKFNGEPSDVSLAGLEGKVIVVSEETQEKYRKDLGDIMTHEEQHTINTLFKGTRSKFYKFGSLPQNIGELRADVQREKVLASLRYERERIDEDRLHDETLAQYSGLDFKPRDIAPLMGVLNSIYHDNFYAAEIMRFKSRLEQRGVKPMVAQTALLEVFDREGQDVVQGAVSSLAVLQNEGFSRDEIINTLETEPIMKWPKVTRRMIEYRQSKADSSEKTGTKWFDANSYEEVGLHGNFALRRAYDRVLPFGGRSFRISELIHERPTEQSESAIKRNDVEASILRSNEWHPRFEVSPELAKKIEIFDEGVLDDTDKEFLLLVLAGEKPATGIAFHQKTNENPEEFTARVDKARSLVKEAGLACEEEKSDVETESLSGETLKFSVYDFHISRDPQLAKEAAQLASKSKMDRKPEDEARYGILMGFPPTAVDAYMEHLDEKTSSSEPELPEEIEFAGYMAFKNFIISPDHWRDELETVKRYAQTIKEVAPDLYQKVTSIRRGIDEFRTEHPEEFKQTLLTDEKMLRGVKFRDPELFEELVRERDQLKERPEIT